MNAAAGFPAVTAAALLMALGGTALFLLYRHLKTLRKEHQRLSYLMQKAPAALFWYDPSGRIRGMNEALLALSGYSASQLKGQVWFERLLPDEQALRLRHQLQNASTGPCTFHADLIKADGTPIAAVLYIHVDKKTGIVCVGESNAVPHGAAGL